MSATTAATSYTAREPEFPAAVVIAEPAVGFFVYWSGVLHGGIHYHYEDAAAHAAKLNAAPAWDLADWRQMTATERAAELHLTAATQAMAPAAVAGVVNPLETEIVAALADGITTDADARALREMAAHGVTLAAIRQSLAARRTLAGHDGAKLAAAAIGARFAARELTGVAA